MIVSAKFIPRRDTAQNWSINNPVLLAGEIGIVTDAIEIKIGDGVTAWNDLKSLYKKDALSNAYTQKTKLSCQAGLKFSIPVSDSSSFLFAPMEVLKFSSSSESETVITACSYDNSDSSSFIYDDTSVSFDGKMQLKNNENIPVFTTPITFKNGFLSNADVDLAEYNILTDYIPPTFTKIADTMGAGYDSSEHEWSQYMEVNDVTKTSLYVKNNTAYGMVNNVFSILSTSWNSLTDDEKWTLFNSTTGEATKDNLISLGEFTIYSYSNENEVPVYKLVCLPFPQLILPKGTISLAGFELTNVDIIHSLSGNSNIKIAITTDLETYYTYNSSTGVFERLSGDISANLVLQEGIDISTISDIPEDAWNDTASIGFAYVLSQSADNENCYTDELKLTVKGNGSWKKAIHGIDYEYEYNNNSTATFSVLTAGDYKINFMS